LFRDAQLGFLRGAKIGVLGANGSGKSHLLRILAGVDREFDGALWRLDGLRVGFLPQEPVLRDDATVGEEVAEAVADKTALLARFAALSDAMGAPDADIDALLAEQAEVQAAIDAADAWSFDHLLAIAKAALRVPPDDARVGSLSGGEKRRVALCKLLLGSYDVLLLDEPTNQCVGRGRRRHALSQPPSRSRAPPHPPASTRSRCTGSRSSCSRTLALWWR
jgi:ATPase subunit of ABC transporter with duplicated ATPase domains